MQSWKIVLILLPAAARLQAAELREDFSGEPSARGWRSYGVADLFHWNQEGQSLEVTWDSSRPNSYFYRPLATVLSKSDDFELSFNLRLDEIAHGTTPGRPFTFELAVGFIHLQSATSTNFVRGIGSASPNLVELDYFPDSGFGATLSPTMVSSNNQFRPSFTFPFELTLGDRFEITMKYTAADHILATRVLRNGEPSGPIKNVQLGAEFTDFRVDTIAISSYSDEGADGSVRARGTFDNIVVTTPEPPPKMVRGQSVEAGYQVILAGAQGWLYTLERTEDGMVWQAVAETFGTDGTEQNLVDPSPPRGPSAHAIYRVRLERP